MASCCFSPGWVPVDVPVSILVGISAPSRYGAGCHDPRSAKGGMSARVEAEVCSGFLDVMRPSCSGSTRLLSIACSSE